MVITGPQWEGRPLPSRPWDCLCSWPVPALHLPCREADIAMCNLVLCDIGDGQDILDNLSTFFSPYHQCAGDIKAGHRGRVW